ncbi:alanine dehydrogenase [Carnobacterium divergens]|uniref:Alanine dehydrogenase n=1 Tax=Carnobacterium divergens TaxID=2748 RepID=A0A7Z8D3I3_CARDV|nr:alanine dehydrogenase [Carnobacterium divergens]TFI75808.1 alanine dehydrogenase [Carnobacterium divergens]TFI79743.1 alanine dehydrogenase [Carnobacterium divergens]TFI86004.1 alanine dehydrogenase [Carnobacterium divergens]TFI98582.1 alanine dehydrogenase [Carnobacterium divergens]TFJ14741.1 alanine dehydrogenase [Carnobacterium divergens]
MRIGIPKEIKNNENRVAIVPAGVATLVEAGHEVFVENEAGIGAGFSNADYVKVGAKMIEEAETVWSANMIMKVKEPQVSEYRYFREDLILFTYLHLAPVKELTLALKESGVTAVAYETMVDNERTLPLLTPMSEVAGRMSVQIGAQFLESQYGGNGTLLAGVPGVKRGKIVIIGGGKAGTNAAKVGIGMGAAVTILDVSSKRLAELDDLFGNQINTAISNGYTIAQELRDADIVIGAVLIPGAKAPKLVTEEMVKEMKKGAVLVDIAIDQGGIFETTDKITTHDDPIYLKHGVIHYAVANMPGAVARTSTLALTNATLPYALQIANQGIKKAAKANPTIFSGLNLMNHEVTYEAVALAHGLNYVSATNYIE